MFNQLHQSVEINNQSVKHFYNNQKELKRALIVKKLLKGKPYLPRLIAVNEKENFLVEERIFTQKLTKQSLDVNHVKLMAETLKDLHSVSIPRVIKRQLADEFTKDFKYHPLRIFEAGLKSLNNTRARKYSKYRYLAFRLESRFSEQPVPLGIVHGDVGSDNIFCLENKAWLIDWNDSRLDLPLVDIYGFFYNFRINDRLQIIFWGTYGKPDYWSKELDFFFKKLHEMFNEVPESISVIIPTHNRCPYQRVSLNPLSTTVESLIQNSNHNIIKNIIIADDCSTDHTFDTYKYLEKKYKKVNFIYFKNKHRCKASFTRRKAINRCPSQLFLMSDDDCIHPKNFINGIYEIFKQARQNDRNIATLNIPFVNKGFKFYGKVPISEYGKTDFDNHWIYHNFDKQPLGIKNKNFIKVDTFDGIYFGVKDRFLLAGNYEDLRGFIVDYAEHISMSFRLAQKGFTFYAAVNKKFLVNHLKFGDQIPDLDLNKFPQKYRGALKRANKPFFNSGDRVHSLKTLESFISSFTYFYFCLSKKEGIKHLHKEYDYLMMQDQINPEKIRAYKNGVLTALKVLKSKKFIDNIEPNMCEVYKILRKNHG